MAGCARKKIEGGVKPIFLFFFGGGGEGRGGVAVCKNCQRKDKI